MRKLLSITANGTRFSAHTGDIILDAALMHGVAFPHDCRAGRCGTCMAKVVRGRPLGGGCAQPGMIYACQARALTDLELRFEVLPPPRSVRARVCSLVRRSADVIEVGLNLDEPIHHRPGQYCTFEFRGFPGRSFSPTAPADCSVPRGDMTLHIKRVRGGRVSTALGDKIAIGHGLRVAGPYGSAFYRGEGGKRLILVAGGTGFAPMLSILLAALLDGRHREIVLIVGTRSGRSLYMMDGLVKLVRFSDVKVIVATQDLAECDHIFRQGEPTDHLPALSPDDLVYAAGAPAMVTRIARLAVEAGADFHCDPFEASGDGHQSGWLARAMARLTAARDKTRPRDLGDLAPPMFAGAIPAERRGAGAATAIAEPPSSRRIAAPSMRGGRSFP